MHIIEHLIAASAPHRCLSCGLEGSPLCLPCSKKLPPAPKCCYKCAKKAQNGLCMACSQSSALDSIRVRTLYSGIAEIAIHQLKFARNQALAKTLGSSMALSTVGVITHVPTANSRIRQRGYDQAKLLAQAVALTEGVAYRTMLRRRGHQRQLGQHRVTRLQQLHQAFYVAAPIVPLHTPLILVDDVLTTGASVESAAQVLRQAGYHRISALVFAWAAPHSIKKT